LSTVLVWITPIFAIIIRFESKGNPFFIQKRIGKNRKIFSCFKFRTMKINSIPEKQANYNDNRITKFGRVLRYSGLDELPQFLNILLGQMSVVGPRPHMIIHNEKFETQISKYKERHKVKPGITGLAQIRGCRGQIEHIADLKIRLKHDLNYINRMNLGLDIYIVFVSIVNMLKGAKNAY
jgi:putative colanic acid biosynthesis UDP-glucose lipid carrier transferase